MATSERLFRDADGAALERVARLEDENRQLRAEVERLAAAGTGDGEPPSASGRTVRPPPSHHLSGRFFLLAMALPFGMLSLLMAAGAARHHGRCPASARAYPAYGIEVVGPQPHRFHMGMPVVAEDPHVRSADPCALPYVVDANGHRRYKRECLP